MTIIFSSLLSALSLRNYCRDQNWMGSTDRSVQIRNNNWFSKGILSRIGCLTLVGCLKIGTVWFLSPPQHTQSICNFASIYLWPVHIRIWIFSIFISHLNGVKTSDKLIKTSSSQPAIAKLHHVFQFYFCIEYEWYEKYYTRYYDRK